MSVDPALAFSSIYAESYYQPTEFRLPAPSRDLIFVPTFRSLVALRDFFIGFPTAEGVLAQIEHHIDQTLLAVIHMGHANIPLSAKLPPVAVTIPKISIDTAPHLRLDPLYHPVTVNFYGQFEADVSSLEVLSVLRTVAIHSRRPDHATAEAISRGIIRNRLHRLRLRPGFIPVHISN